MKEIWKRKGKKGDAKGQGKTTVEWEGKLAEEKNKLSNCVLSLQRKGKGDRPL